jgi:redox-sensitive bicupin YhaK (pirin superfamily)
MTAGRGIVHSERTPARERARTHTLSGQRIWVALPRALEDLPPDLSHHAESELPCIESDGASLTIVAGEAFNRRSPVPVHSDLMYLDVVLKAGARLKVPSGHIERAAFVISGEIGVNGPDLCYREMQLVVFKSGAEIVLQANSGAHVMLLGGEPFPEPRHVYWNFVSSSQDRIRQAAEDWRNGGFPRIAGESELTPLPQPDDLAAW